MPDDNADANSTEGAPAPPAGMTGEPGPLLRIVHDQRVAFLIVGGINTVVIVGGINTVVGFAWFIGFQLLLQDWLGYMVVLLCAHVASVLCAFVLYRRFVFRVRGHVIRDLGRFEVVNLAALGINAALLPLLVEVFGLQVLVSQSLIVSVTMLVSFFGHRGFSFRRTSADHDRLAAREQRKWEQK
jgi:putative flippase GtrA